MPVSRRTAAVEEWLLLFLLFSAAGWVWEVLYTALATGRWVNRGMLRGPWLPVYGLGGILLAGILSRLPVWSAPLLGAALGGGVEYAASLALEWRFRQRWWDYSGLPGSLQGRVCLASLAAFALAGWALSVLTPSLRRAVGRLPPNTRTLLCRAAALVLALDWALALLAPNAGPGVSCPL